VTIAAWRIYKPKHAAAAFSGAGARDFGGRFNPKGVAIVYTSASVSLATLEMLVHLQSAELLQAYVLRHVTFDHALVRKITEADLPANWRANPAPPESQRIGADWVAAAESAVLQVPSVVITTESNFLLNPLHPDFKKLTFGKEEPFNFDPRLIKTSGPRGR
jgi:RES domain-containing protein